MTIFLRDIININQLGVRSLFGCYVFLSLRKMLVTWLFFQIGNFFFLFPAQKQNITCF